jgi:hypothetical protein
VTGPQQFPVSRFVRGAGYRADAQSLPQLAEGTQSRGFGKFSAQLLSRLGGRERPFRIKKLP